MALALLLLVLVLSGVLAPSQPQLQPGTDVWLRLLGLTTLYAL
nr:hypothetical protein [Haliscomenobacter sp.]